MPSTIRKRRYPAKQDTDPPTISRSAAGSSYPCGSMKTLNLPPPFERFVPGPIVGVLEVAPDRHPHRNPRHADAKRLEEPRKIDGRGLSFNVGIGRQNHFSDAVVHPCQQLLDLEIVGPDALQ